MKTIIVCAAVIERAGKVLLAQRKPVGDQGSKWEFPGGKLIPGETPAQCLIREIREELAMSIGVSGVFEVVSHCYQPGVQILLLAYLCEHLSGEGATLDCQAFRWVRPAELLDYDLAEADWSIRAKYLGR